MLTPTKILVSQNNQTYNGKKKQTRTEIKINYNLLILKINLCAFETLTSEEVY